MKTVRRIPGYLQTLKRTNCRQATLPRMLTYIVTFTCNARCIMCDSWKMSGKDDLRIDEIENIMKQLPQMDVVRLTGGEPFVRKDLPEIAALVQKHLQPFMLHITSNGFLTDRIVEFCEKRDKTIPLSLLISLDGVEEKHNHVRGRDTAWQTATKTLRLLAPRRKELGLSLAINQTIVDADSIRHYKLLREELGPLNIPQHMVMAYDVSATYSLERDRAIEGQIGQFTTFGDFDEAHLRDFFDEVERDLARLPLGERVAKAYYLKGVRNRILGDRQEPNPKCVALTTHMRLYPNGDVPTCQFNSKTVGNLREKTFREIWYGPEIEKNRDWVRKCPGCWAECEVLPSAIYTGDIVRETVLPRKSYLGAG